MTGFRAMWNRVLNLGRTSPPEIRQNYIYMPGTKVNGVRVTHENALTFTAVWACVRVISEDLAKMPWRVMKEDKTVDAEHPADWILHKQPNPEMSAFTWRETMAAWALTWGDAVSEIVRDRALRVAETWPLSPDRVDITRTRNGQLVYDIDNGAGQPNTVLLPEDVFHLHGLGYDGIRGYSPIMMHRRSIGLGLAMEETGNGFYGNRAVPLGIIQYKAPNLPANVKKETEQEWNKISAGNGRRIGVLGGEASYQAIGMSAQDAEYVASRQFTVEDVCRIYRVPPHKVQHLLRSTFSNIEQQSIEYVQDTLQPWATRLEQEADRKFLGRNQRGRLYTKINLNSLMRGDSAARKDFYWQLFQMGVFSPNEIRALEDMPKIEGEDGDKRLVGLNLTTLDKAGEEVEPPAPEPEAETADVSDADMLLAVANRLNGKGATNGRH